MKLEQNRNCFILNFIKSVVYIVYGMYEPHNDRQATMSCENVSPKQNKINSVDNFIQTTNYYYFGLNKFNFGEWFFELKTLSFSLSMGRTVVGIALQSTWFPIKHKSFKMFKFKPWYQ